jgi:hypothetical protein
LAHLELESICLDIILDLLADPRQKRCFHTNIFEQAELNPNSLTIDEAISYMISLPGQRGEVALIWPPRN